MYHNYLTKLIIIPNITTHQIRTIADLFSGSRLKSSSTTLRSVLMLLNVSSKLTYTPKSLRKMLQI